jgi:hypothetical protein
METTQILAEIVAEIERLEQVRTLLIGATTKRGPGRPAATKKRTLSPEARERISAAQRKRWAKLKQAAK